MEKHTPGPWGVEQYEGKGDWFVWDSNGNRITIGLPLEIAQKIAAVPDLLAACKLGLERMEAELKNCGGKSGYLEPMIEQAKAAIAKATGNKD